MTPRTGTYCGSRISSSGTPAAASSPSLNRVVDSTPFYLRLIYEDSAPQFDPLLAGQRTDIDTTINERQVGGLGIFITIGLAEKADYSYVEGRNRICLRLSAARN